jgi:hypothetical protein
MTYNFFADRNDKLDVLNFILNETDLCIYDKDSNYEEEIVQYHSLDEISSKFELTNGGKFAVTFQLWSARHRGKPIFRRIELKPEYCDGHTYRYSTNGWGLIQLYFGGIENNQLNQSHIGHFNEKEALGWQNTNKINDKVSDWDWKEIQITSRKLKYQIHNKLAVRKIGSFGILKFADDLERQGIILR